MEKLSDFYEINLPERIVQEYTYDCLLDLGKLAIERYFVKLRIKDYKIPIEEIPCNLYYVISVTRCNGVYVEDGKLLEYNFRYNKNYVEKPYGIFVDYELDDKGFTFNVTDMDVYVEYDGIKVDENNNILFEEDALNAVVAYVIHKNDYAKWRSGKISGDIYRESERIMEMEMMKARRPHFNRNHFDKIVKALYSYNANRYFY